MTREPWQITRDMFLSVDEVDRLLAHVRAGADHNPPDDRAAAFVDRVLIESVFF
jgi:hypothetical protein